MIAAATVAGPEVMFLVVLLVEEEVSVVVSSSLSYLPGLLFRLHDTSSTANARQDKCLMRCIWRN
jgi:hypothetical protein